MSEEVNKQAIFKKRMSYLGNGDQYFYKEPLHIIKGDDVW